MPNSPFFGCEKRLTVLLVLGVALSGCATPPRPAPPKQALSAWLNQPWQLEKWQVRGRIAVKIAERGYSGGLRWEQDGDEFDLSLQGPLGRQAFRLAGHPERVRVTDEAGAESVTEDPEQLMREEFGWSVPLDALPYWVRGLPAPELAVKSIERDAAGLLRACEQAGWQLRIETFSDVSGLSLPRRIDLVRGAVRVRLVLREWQLTA